MAQSRLSTLNKVQVEKNNLSKTTQWISDPIDSKDTEEGRSPMDRTEKGSFFRLVIHIGGIVCAYTVYGFLLERITSTKYGEEGERFNAYFMLLFSACSFNAVFAFVALKMRPSDNTAAVPQYNYILIAVAYVGAMFGSSFSLKFVSYPTQVLAKSCKMIPVMAMGILLGKKYTQVKYVCVGMITTGVAIFVYNKTASSEHAESENSVTGLALLVFSLFCDGFTSAFEEKVVATWNPSALQMMESTNMYGAALTFAMAAAHGEVASGGDFFQRHPQCVWDVLMYAMTGAVGQLFIFNTIREFGALVCSTATTLRKFFNVVWSVFWFGHHVAFVQALGAVLVFGGLALDIHDRFSMIPA